VYVGGRPGRGASSRPDNPAALKRRIQARTVLSASPSPRAIAGAGCPSLASRMIDARRAWRTGAACERASRSTFSRSSAVNLRMHIAMARLPPLPPQSSCQT
jgi:hypothetical protein